VLVKTVVVQMMLNSCNVFDIVHIRLNFFTTGLLDCFGCNRFAGLSIGLVRFGNGPSCTPLSGTNNVDANRDS